MWRGGGVPCSQDHVGSEPSSSVIAGSPPPYMYGGKSENLPSFTETRNGCHGIDCGAAGVVGKTAYIANIGDSRALLYRQGVLQQISKDHTDQFLLDLHGINNRKPRLTQHLGIEPEEMVIEPYLTEVVIQPGDLFLLCTDGLTDMIAVDEITHTLQKNIDVMETVAALINRAMDYGGRDNATVMLCRVELE